MKSCNTTIARSMGYLSSPSIEERTFDGSNIVIIAPSSADIRSYHHGETSRSIYQKSRDALKKAGFRKRGRREVLYTA